LILADEFKFDCQGGALNKFQDENDHPKGQLCCVISWVYAYGLGANCS